ncbi:MAG: methyltransferase [Bacteroidetes bacterium]|nr:methyltransferase [Bacteroidota bacterium]
MGQATFTCKQFSVKQDQCAMKVSTDACIFGAWVAQKIVESGLPSPRILDIGTGTGLLSLMTAQQLTSCTITAMEIDEAAAQQATENIQHSPWCKNIQVQQGDIKQYDDQYGFDVIISNPPFFERDLLANSRAKNLAFHDTSLTLPELLMASCRLLNATGYIFLLLPVSRKNELVKDCESLHLCITDCCYVRPGPNKIISRILVVCRRNNGSSTPACKQTDLIVQGDHNDYSPDAISLLKDYYLYL